MQKLNFSVELLPSNVLAALAGPQQVLQNLGWPHLAEIVVLFLFVHEEAVRTKWGWQENVVRILAIHQ